MPHADPQKSSGQKSSVEQSISTSSSRGKRDKLEIVAENSDKEVSYSDDDDEETPTGSSRSPPSKGREQRKDEDDGSRGSGGNGSTQSSAGDSSDLPGFKIPKVSADTNIGNSRSGSGITTAASSDPNGEAPDSSSTPGPLIKEEENIAASQESPPDRGGGFARRDSSRKSVRILEPTGSSGRLSPSCQSLDIDDADDFMIDTGEMQHSTTRRFPFRRQQSEANSSFMRDLTSAPTQEAWDKYTQKSLLWKIRIVCGKVVENPYVQLAIIALIIINAIFMGIATFDFVTDNEDVDKGFSSLDRAFLVVFTIELALQLVYRSFSYFTDPWMVFDFIIVVLSWSLESLQIVRAFRIFRAFRLVTRIGPLRELVMAIGAVMPRMYAIAMLLLLIFYIFAVLFTELFHDLNTEVNYFGSLDVSLFTCMELMTLEWAGVARSVMEEKSWAWAPILAFLSVTGFIVFNLIVAVVCDAVAVVDREVQAERLGEFETDTTKLEKAQERIWDMTEHVERMLHAQKELQEVLLKLNTEMEELTGESTGIVPPPRRSSRRLVQ